MTMTIDEIDAEIAKWERRCRNWLWWDERAERSDLALELVLHGARACLDEIEKLRRQRAQFDETIGKCGEVK